MSAHKVEKTKEERAKYAREWYAKNKGRVNAKRRKTGRGPRLPAQTGLRRMCRYCGELFITEKIGGWVCKLCRNKRKAECQSRLNRDPERKRKNQDLKYRQAYGIGLDDVEALIARAGGVCEICRVRPEPDSLGRTLHIDHCHKSGRIRGVLCFSCNTSLGKLKEDPEIVRALLNYLETRCK